MSCPLLYSAGLTRTGQDRNTELTETTRWPSEHTKIPAPQDTVGLGFVINM